MTGTTKPVLIVEDDDDAREALAAFLEGEGYQVLEAHDGREALDRLRLSPVCLVLLDLMMPVMNGWAFRAEQLRDPALASVPVVVVTADTTAVSRVGALGVAACMTKPLDLDRLLDVVGRHC
jgi:DNA-binding response OmpR family regulator